MSIPVTPPSDRLALPQVTLIAATSVAISATVRALRLSQEQVSFGRVVLLSHIEPPGLAENFIEWRQIAPMWSRAAYSKFILHQLADHVDTEFALVSQWDGYVLDSRLWQPAFLSNDYIGAPWPQFDDGFTVGNGGFSLRSRRLLKATKLIEFGNEAEDAAICRTNRRWLEQRHGIRFAPGALAQSFSFERGERQAATFGFHGVFNMMASMAPEAFAIILRSIEPRVLGRKELQEVLAHAFRIRHAPMLTAALRHRVGGNTIFGRVFGANYLSQDRASLEPK